jgi:predicted kinase
LILITGIMASGKSTVAQAVAERLPRSVHLRGDQFRRMIVNGREQMSAHLSKEARRQLDLRYRLAAEAASLYLSAGFSVVYQDIILGDDLGRVLTYHSHRPIYVVVLCPDPDVVAQRAGSRSKPGYGDGIEVGDLDRALRSATPRIGRWLDNSALTVAETADTILARLDDAAITDAPLDPQRHRKIPPVDR